MTLSWLAVVGAFLGGLLSWLVPFAAFAAGLLAGLGPVAALLLWFSQYLK